MTNYENKLDNPAWYSLSETHKQFEIEFGDVKFYPPEYCQFGGIQNCVLVFTLWGKNLISQRALKSNKK